VHALIAHGRDADKLPVAWAERAETWLQRLGVPHALRLYPGGHASARRWHAASSSGPSHHADISLRQVEQFR
jgi:predicted esterase